jgi:type IV pilus assembly protein PilA
MKKDKDAFTLIELLVVVAIIGILAAVGVVAYNGYTNAAKKSATKANHKIISKYIQGEVLKCNTLGQSSAFDGGWSSCPENNPNRLTIPAYNSLKDKFKNPFNPNDSAVWAYGNFSGRAAWTPGATIIAAFYINGIGTLYISTCFEEQCYPTDPGPNPPIYGPGVLTSAIPLN